MSKVELLDECNNSLGEGITYSSNDNFLYWLDIGNPQDYKKAKNDFKNKIIR